jgi:hypothetical protein
MHLSVLRPRAANVRRVQATPSTRLSGMDPVPWRGFAEPGARIHVLHGGDRDDLGVFQCVRHLQVAWRATGLVLCETPAALVTLAASLAAFGRNDAHLIICVPADAVAAAPAAYDVLCSRPVHVTVVVLVPVATVVRSNAGSYSTGARITVVTLPSCRLHRSPEGGLEAAATVYRFRGCPPHPSDTLEAALGDVPHGYAIAWACSRYSSASLVCFHLEPGMAADAATAPVRWRGASADAAAHAAVRAATALPADIACVAFVDGALPLTAARPTPAAAVTLPCGTTSATRAGANRLLFVSAFEQRTLDALMRVQSFAHTAFHGHVLGADGVVVPIVVRLSGAQPLRAAPPETRVLLSATVVFVGVLWEAPDRGGVVGEARPSTHHDCTQDARAAPPDSANTVVDDQVPDAGASLPDVSFYVEPRELMDVGVCAA